MGETSKRRRNRTARTGPRAGWVSRRLAPEGLTVPPSPVEPAEQVCAGLRFARPAPTVGPSAWRVLRSPHTLASRRR